MTGAVFGSQVTHRWPLHPVPFLCASSVLSQEVRKAALTMPIRCRRTTGEEHPTAGSRFHARQHPLIECELRHYCALWKCSIRRLGYEPSLVQ